MHCILKKAFSTQNQTSYAHDKEDNVLIFGAVAAIISLVTGGFLFLFLVAQNFDTPLKLLGLAWMVYSGLILVGIDLFERTRKKEAAWYLAILGIMGILFGVGFFLGGAMTLLAGYLALRYHCIGKGHHKVLHKK